MDAELAQLVREQELFLQQRKRPSATVTRWGSAPERASGGRPNPELVDRTPGHVAGQVLKNVVERHATVSVGPNERLVLSGLNPKNPLGFPSVTRRQGVGDKKDDRRGRTKTSRFGRQRLAAQQHADKETSDTEEMRAIDAMNRARVRDMSAQEVQEAQQELVQTLDAQLIAKLRSRRQTGEVRASTHSAERARVLTEEEEGAGAAGGKDGEDGKDGDGGDGGDGKDGEAGVTR